MSDAISLQVIVDAAAAVRSMKEAKEAADAVTAGFLKLTDVEAALVLETARAQKALRDAAAEEQRVARYMAEAAKLRNEETAKFRQVAREAAEQTKRLASENAALAKSHEQLASAITRTKNETQALKKSNDDAASALASSQSKLGLLTTNIGDLGAKIRAVSPLWGTMAATAVASFARISAGVVGVGVGLAHATMELGRHAAEAERAERAERLLGSAFDQVRAATADTVSAQDALRTQQSLLQSNLSVTGEQLATITARARTFALATGGETPDALNDMTDALRGLEQDGLEKYGIQLQRTGDRQRDFDEAVRQLTSTQTEAARAATKWGTALSATDRAAAELQQTLSGQRTMAEEVARTTREFDRMTSTLASSVAKSLELTQVFRFMADSVIPALFDRANEDARAQRDTDGSIMLRRAAERAQERGNARNAISALVSSGQLSQEQFSEYSNALNVRGASREDFIRVQESARRATRETAPVAQSMMREVFEPLTAAARQQREAAERSAAQQRTIDQMRAAVAADGERKLRKLGDAADNAARSLNLIQRAQARSLAGRAGITNRNDNEFSDMLGRLAAPSEDEVTAEENERLKAEVAFAAEREGTQREAARRSRIAQRDRETRRRARSESFLGQITAGLGMERDDEGKLKGLHALELTAKGLVTTLGTLQSGFAEFFTTVASGAMSAGDAAIVMGSKFLSTLGQMAVQEGTTMLFKAIPAAFEAPPLAAAYVAGGIGLIGVGVGLGAAGAAAMPPRPSAGGGTGASASTDRNGLRSASSSTSRERSYGDYNVTFSSFVPAGVVDAINARNALRRVRRAGYDDGARIPRRVEH
jgi:hypothetical protein